MKKIKWGAALLCALCAIFLCLLPLLMKNNEKAPEETGETVTDSGEDGEKDPSENPDPQENFSSRVEIPTAKDPETGETFLSFPCAVSEYGLVLKKLDSYEGVFVEDGTNRLLSSVAMLLVENTGSLPVEYAVIYMFCGSETLEFSISALPAGASLLVQEKTGKAPPAEKPEAGEATVIPRAELEMNEKSVLVKDNGDSSLTVTNLTEETLSSVRVFYKYYQEGVYVGGIAFNLNVTDLPAGKSKTVMPAHFTSADCRVVMVQI